MNWLRTGLLNGLYPLLTDYFGLSVSDVENRINTDLSPYASLDNRVPLDDAIALFNNCAEITQCDYFGALLAKEQPRDALGMLSIIGENSERFESAFVAIISNMALNVTGANWRMAKDGSFTQLIFSIHTKHPITQACQFAMAQAHILFKTITHNQWKPLQVCFSSGPPKNIRPLKQIFGDQIYFNREYNGFVVDNQLMSLEIAGRNTRIFSLVNDYLKLTGRSSESDRIEQIRLTIRSSLMLRQQCTLQDVADSQNIGVRALQYFLKRHDLSYQLLLDEVRYQLARDLLVSSGHQVSKIAFMVGFTDAATFTRAFKKVEGKTPMQYRKKSRMRDA